MKRYLAVLGSALLLAAPWSNVNAQDWRGLKPFHSSRTDVEKLFGEPPPPPSDGSHFYTLNKNRSIYRLDEGQLYIIYKRDDWHSDACWKSVLTDTVVFIQMTFKKPIPLKEFPINVERSKQFDPSSPPNIGFSAYIDEASGLMVRTFKGNVDEAYYFAASANKPPCADYYERLRGAASILVH